MNYMSYHPIDVINGKGTRVSLFVSGCSLACKGCFSQKSHNPKSGHPFTEDMAQDIINELNSADIPKKGLSILGGDPLEPYNLDSIKSLILKVRKESPNKDIWLWTGRVLETMSPEQKEVAMMVDTLIDGPFQIEMKDPSFSFRGSSNQRIINIRNI